MPYEVPDPLLKPMMLEESGGNPNAVSPKGAIGLMQIMPATAAQYGVSPELLHNPVVNLWLWRRIMADNLSRYRGDLTKALEAYNAGPKRVDQNRVPSSTVQYTNVIERGFNRALEALGPSSAEAQDVPPAAMIPEGKARKFNDGKYYKNIGGQVSEVSPSDLVPTPEQRYERGFQQLPRAAQAVAPSTLGEAGFMIGALPAAAAAIGLAPETAGMSLAPILGALIGGAAEDPSSVRNALGGMSWEGTKGIFQELGGRAVAKGVELGARTVGKAGILQRGLTRIAQAIPSLFYEYPGSVPSTSKELQDSLGGGDITRAAGAKIDRFRDYLDRQFGKYSPGQAPKLIPASSGQPYHYSVAIAPSGRPFRIHDVDANGDIIQRTVGIREAIDITRELFAGSRSATGAQKVVASAPKQLDAAVMNRTALKEQLNRIHPGWGDRLEGYSGDYGVAKQLENTFAGSRRTARIRSESVGVVNQPKLLKQADKVQARLNRVRPGAGTRLTEIIAPTGAEAKEEIPFGPRGAAGAHGFHAYMHLPAPYRPETRELLPWQARILSDPRLAPLLGALGLSGSEEAFGVK